VNFFWWNAGLYNTHTLRHGSLMWGLYMSLLAVAKKDHSDFDCFVLAVLTHGDVGDEFFGVDGKSFSLGKLMEPIKRCRTLAGKPKICIVQVTNLYLWLFKVTNHYSGKQPTSYHSLPPWILVKQRFVCAIYFLVVYIVHLLHYFSEISPSWTKF